MSEVLFTFHVFFVDGESLRVRAPGPDEARKIAKARRPGLFITKCKRVKE